MPSGPVPDTHKTRCDQTRLVFETLSLRHHKNVFAVHDRPVAPLPIPVAVLVGAPVSVVPVGIGMDHCGVGSGLDCGSGSGVDRVGVCDVGRRVCASLFVGSGRVGTGLVYRRLSAAFCMGRCAVLGVNCRPVLGVNRLAPFAASLTSVSTQGCNGDQGGETMTSCQKDTADCLCSL
jgi:hypothetical protein